jgi:hypothetical protein
MYAAASRSFPVPELLDRIPRKKTASPTDESSLASQFGQLAIGEQSSPTSSQSEGRHCMALQKQPPATTPIGVEHLARVAIDLRGCIDKPPFYSERSDAIFMLNEIQARSVLPDEALYVALQPTQAPAGLMKLGAFLPPMPGIPCSTVSVQQMLAYPPRKRGGSALVQTAVNHAQLKGSGGNLRLQSLSEADTKFYEKLGFEQTGPWHVLVPSSKPNIWNRAPSGEWSLKRLTTA